MLRGNHRRATEAVREEIVQPAAVTVIGRKPAQQRAVFGKLAE